MCFSRHNGLSVCSCFIGEILGVTQQWYQSGGSPEKYGSAIVRLGRGGPSRKWLDSRSEHGVVFVLKRGARFGVARRERSSDVTGKHV